MLIISQEIIIWSKIRWHKLKINSKRKVVEGYFSIRLPLAGTLDYLFEIPFINRRIVSRNKQKSPKLKLAHWLVRHRHMTAYIIWTRQISFIKTRRRDEGMNRANRRENFSGFTIEKICSRYSDEFVFGVVMNWIRYSDELDLV